jgi:hypothetical protein
MRFLANCRIQKKCRTPSKDLIVVRGDSMTVQIVMDNSGDSRFEFDPTDQASIAEAMQRFEHLTALGYTAAERTGSGMSRKVTTFDPSATEVLFIPRLVGG